MLAWAMRAHGVPDQILTDNGKVFTARFGKGPGPVLFDRICADNGIRHLLTAPYSPTTTGKVERFHKTLRAGFLGPNNGAFATIEAAQEALDAWVSHYNTERPHQSLGMSPPAARFALAAGRNDVVDTTPEPEEQPAAPPPRPPGVIRWVDAQGHISLAGFAYRVGRVFSGEPVEVVCQQGLVEVVYTGALIATHAERRRPDDHRRRATPRAVTVRRARPATSGPGVTRLADAGGNVSFAGATTGPVGASPARASTPSWAARCSCPYGAHEGDYHRQLADALDERPVRHRVSAGKLEWQGEHHYAESDIDHRERQRPPDDEQWKHARTESHGADDGEHHLVVVHAHNTSTPADGPTSDG